MKSHLLLAALAAVFVASPAAGAPQAARPDAPRTDSGAPPASQSDVEAQLTKMLEELRRENARRRASAEPAAVPDAATAVVRPSPPPAPPARALPKLPSTLVASFSSLRPARLSPPPPPEPRALPVLPVAQTAARPLGAPRLSPPPPPRVTPVLPSRPLVASRLGAPRLSGPPPVKAVPISARVAPPPVEPEPPAVAPAPPALAPATAAAAPPPVEPEPTAVPAAPAAEPPAAFGPLPWVEGFTSEEVRAFLGPPNTIQQGATGVIAWYYTTPAGRLPVYFVGDIATFSSPIVVKRGAPPVAPARRAPDDAGFCRGTRALVGPKLIAIALPDTPAFIEPRFRQVPLALLPAGSRIEVIDTDGAWYLVRFRDERWGQRNGYVHCRTVGERPSLLPSSPPPSAP